MSRLNIFLSVLATVVWLSTVRPAGTSDLAASPAQGRAGAEDSLAIVVNQSNPVDNLGLVELRKVFLGETNHWSDGRRITVVMLDPGKPERQAVLSQIYKMDDKDFNNYFLHGMFTGEIHSAPKSLATPTEVLKFVFNVPGAIGYLRAAEADENVKVVRIEGHLPSDKDYAIRLHAKPVK